MQNKALHAIFALLISCLGQSVAYSQQPSDQTDPNDQWIRVQSDNGEFSIEVPVKYKFYYDKDGFSVSYMNRGEYQLKNMRMLNAFHSGTLLSFEVYEVKKGALNAIYESDTYKKNDIEKSKIKRTDHYIQQIEQKTDKFFLVRQYFNSKTHIYILTAASRTNETPSMRRFLDSLVFKQNTKDVLDPKGVLLSKLPITQIGVEERLEKEPVYPQVAVKPPDKPKDENIIPFTIVVKHRASYTDQARRNGIKGTIRLKPTLSADGFVPHIVVTQSLPNGLLRQALFAAIRIKFLPKENHGTFETVVATVEYGFDIY